MKLENIVVYKDLSFIINDISIELIEKGLIYLAGESGSGKTTLLNVISGNYKPAGKVIINNCDVYENDKSISEYKYNYVGYVGQEFHCLTNLTVLENINIAIAFTNKHYTSSEIDVFLKKYNLFELKNIKMNKLSGGEKQRTCLLKAILMDKKILIADEVLSSQDKENYEIILAELYSYSKNHLVIMTNHRFESLPKCDQYILLDNGRIIDNKIYSNDNAIGYEIVKQEKISLKTSYLLQKDFFGKNRVLQYLFIVLMIILVTIIGFSSSVFSYNEKEAYADLLLEENVKLLYGQTANTLKSRKKYYDKYFEKNDYEYFYKYKIKSNKDISSDFEQYSAYYQLFSRSNESAVFIDDDILSKNKLSILSGRLPEKKSEVCISNIEYEKFRQYGFKSNISSTLIDNKEVSYEKIIGQKIEMAFDIVPLDTDAYSIQYDEYVIVGIIETGFNFDTVNKACEKYYEYNKEDYFSQLSFNEFYNCRFLSKECYIDDIESGLFDEASVSAEIYLKNSKKEIIKQISELSKDFYLLSVVSEDFRLQSGNRNYLLYISEEIIPIFGFAMLIILLIYSKNSLVSVQKDVKTFSELGLTNKKIRIELIKGFSMRTFIILIISIMLTLLLIPLAMLYISYGSVILYTTRLMKYSILSFIVQMGISIFIVLIYFIFVKIMVKEKKNDRIK